MDDLYIPIKLEKCCLIQALEYLGLGWFPYSMTDEYIIDRKRFNPGGYINSMSENTTCSSQEIKYWEKIEKGCAILLKAIKMGKITHFYGKFCIDNNQPIEKVEFNGRYYDNMIDFCEGCICLGNSECYTNILFDTADIEKLLKQKTTDTTYSINDKKRLVRQIAVEKFNSGINKELELYDVINNELNKKGIEPYSRRRLDELVHSLNLSLEKNSRGRPKKTKKSIT